MTLKAVAFDVDGTLYPNASMLWRSLPLAVANSHLLRALEKARIELHDHPEHLPDVHETQAVIVARILGISVESARARIEAVVYTRWYQTFHALKPYAGLLPLLRRLKDSGYKLAVMSDFSIRGRLEALGLDGWWDLSFSSEEVGWLKPHAQPFLHIADTFGLPPGQVLYVGNSVTYDVRGAHAAGMPCAHLGRRSSKATTAAITFRNYRELDAFLFDRSST
ncbi:MAG: HAD family hydrolase [Spirochaetales bacterium]